MLGVVTMDRLMRRAAHARPRRAARRTGGAARRPRRQARHARHVGRAAGHDLARGRVCATRCTSRTPGAGGVRMAVAARVVGAFDAAEAPMRWLWPWPRATALTRRGRGRVV